MIHQISQEKTICLDVPATFKYLHIVSSCLDGVLTQEADLAKQEYLSYNVQLAVQEICTNIVRHAYKERENERIRVKITLELHPRSLVIEIFDTGMPCKECDVTLPNLDEGQVNGYGLFIVRNLMDEVTYQREPEGNFWYLTKKL